MGVVYLGADPEGRNVAIKVLRPAVAGDATARRRLAREVDSMRRVHSPHVAEILDADVTAEQPYIVTQYVPGRTLEEVVEDGGPVEGTDLQTLAVGLASALSAIHGAGIVHRDLKPGNVMLMDGGEPVVIDFGIAQAADSTRLTATGMVIGTPGYLAPEIIEGHEAGPQSDVHAWAGTLAYAATGRPPFGSGTFEAIFYKIMSGKPDLDGVPAPILPVLRAAIARDPSERPKAVDLVPLTRRLHFDSTVTDQTRVDRHYAAGAPAGDATGPSGGDDPDQAGQFSMPPPATGEAAGWTATPPPMPAPAPVPSQQPSDFVGQLPPALRRPHRRRPSTGRTSTPGRGSTGGRTRRRSGTPSPTRRATSYSAARPSSRRTTRVPPPVRTTGGTSAPATSASPASPTAGTGSSACSSWSRCSASPTSRRCSRSPSPSAGCWCCGWPTRPPRAWRDGRPGAARAPVTRSRRRSGRRCTCPAPSR
ncbi:hypothetical protein BJF79_29385 [Actinomadura sp. CNU-125]|nr:hypothetical protein BJF79_29385 [Actinomadura sp. CNU-125]